MKHEFVEQVRGDARRTLCVVVGAAQLAEDGTVHMHIDKEGDVEEDASAVSLINYCELRLYRSWLERIYSQEKIFFVV